MFPTDLMRADLRSKFHRHTLECQRRLCVTAMTFTTLAFLLACIVRQTMIPAPGPLYYRLACALGLMFVTWRLANTSNVFHFGLRGLTFVLLLQGGMAMNAAHAPEPLYWLLPALVLIPIGAAPLWLTPRHFAVGTLTFFVLGALSLSALPFDYDDRAICLLWGVVSLSTCILFKLGFYSFRFRHFALRQRLNDLTGAIDVSQQDTSCVTHAEWSGIGLSTHFQPLYSLAHQKTVGFEVLLRGHRADGTPVSPPHIFAEDPSADVEVLDRLTQRLHFSRARTALPDGAWLFLNVLPVTFLRPDHPAFLKAVVEQAGLTTTNIVLEVLESQNADIAALSHATARYRAHGFRIAIDDFGAGHSNLDRLLRIQPDIVKLDGDLIRARCRSTTRPLLPNIVSLLHNVGMLVAVEGIETAEDLANAVESNADIAQGYLLGRPAQGTEVSLAGAAEVEQAFKQVGERRAARSRAFAQQLRPYLDAMSQAITLLQSGAAPLASLPLLSLPLCYGGYLLDATGRAIADPCFPSGKPPPVPNFPPVLNNTDARWDNRPFFVEALSVLGRPVFSQPYHSVTVGGACVALACAFYQNAQLTVLVIKLDWGSSTPGQQRERAQ